MLAASLSSPAAVALMNPCSVGPTVPECKLTTTKLVHDQGMVCSMEAFFSLLWIDAMCRIERRT